MVSVVLFDNRFITVECVADCGLIRHTVHRPVPGHILRKALEAGSEALEKHSLCKWLSDDRNNGPILDENIQWGITEWGPRAVRAGWKYWAIVAPEQFAAVGTLEPIVNAYFEIGVHLMIFTTVEAALNWLNSQTC